jgi:branched-chain amino acid transport system substrate-binding protein
MNRRHFLSASTVLPIAIATSYSPTSLAANGAPIIIGQSAPLTGPASQLGIQFRAGAQLYLDQFNARGGVLNHPVKLQTLDDGYDPSRTISNTETLLATPGLVALFGYIGTPTTLAAVPYFTKKSVPLVAPFTGAESLREPFNPLIFHVRASYFDETAAIVKLGKNLSQKTFAVFYQNDSFGAAGLQGVTKALADQGLPAPVVTATVERNSTDVAAAAAKIAKFKPDAVVMISAYTSCAAFVRACKGLKVQTSFSTVSFVGSQALSDALGEDGAGVQISQVMPNPELGSTALAKGFLAACEKSNFLVQPNYSSLEGWASASVLCEGLKRIRGAITPASVIAGLESIKNFDLGGVPISYSNSNHKGSNFVELTIIGRNGKLLR